MNSTREVLKHELPVLLLLGLLAISMHTGLLGQGDERARRTLVAPRFEVHEVRVDPGESPLAAYQVEIQDPTGRVQLVGIEGGDHPAYRTPPHYDPAALRGNRVILAALSTDEELPSGPSVVARLHVMVEGDGEPDFQTRLVAAASRDGTRLPAKLEIVPAN